MAVYNLNEKDHLINLTFDKRNFALKSELKVCKAIK